MSVPEDDLNNVDETQENLFLNRQKFAANVAKTDVSAEADAARDQTSDDAPDDARPFEINVAERIKNLPPYLFAELNARKYAKRRAGAQIENPGAGKLFAA